MSKARKLRRSQDVSQEELGKKIGKARSTISRYEAGTLTPSLDVIMDIAGALGVPFTTLLDEA